MRRNRARHLSTTLLGGALMLGSALAAHANPKDIPAGSKLVYNFNVIGYPEGQIYNGGCGNGPGSSSTAGRTMPKC